MFSRVYVEITNVCNMHCSFCHGHKRPARQMRREEFARILDQLQGITSYVYYHLMGEPLLHPDLPVFLSMAKEKGFQSVLTTNGTLLDRRGEELLAAGLHKVSVSIHSFEGDSPEKHRQYLEKVANFSEKAAQAGTIVSLRLWNKGCDGGRNDQTLEILRQLLPGEWKENSRGLRLRDRLFLEWGERFQWPDANAQVQGERFFCYGLRDHCGILCDGTVVPCCLDSEGTVALGNVFSGELRDILDSSRAKAMVEGFSCGKATEELCRRCGYAQRFVNRG